MTREETKEAIKVMQAYVDGKEIEFCFRTARGTLTEWSPFEKPNWDFSLGKYRIKEEPKPFDWRGKNIQWVRMKDNPAISCKKVITTTCEGVIIPWAETKQNMPFELCVKMVGWEVMAKHWEWSEDNKTWREFV